MPVPAKNHCVELTSQCERSVRTPHRLLLVQGVHVDQKAIPSSRAHTRERGRAPRYRPPHAARRPGLRISPGRRRRHGESGSRSAVQRLHGEGRPLVAVRAFEPEVGIKPTTCSLRLRLARALCWPACLQVVDQRFPESYLLWGGSRSAQVTRQDRGESGSERTPPPTRASSSTRRQHPALPEADHGRRRLEARLR